MNDSCGYPHYLALTLTLSGKEKFGFFCPQFAHNVNENSYLQKLNTYCAKCISVQISVLEGCYFHVFPANDGRNALNYGCNSIDPYVRTSLVSNRFPGSVSQSVFGLSLFDIRRRSGEREIDIKGRFPITFIWRSSFSLKSARQEIRCEENKESKKGERK